MAVQYYTNSAGQTEAKFIKILRKKLDEKGMDVNIWLWYYRFTGINRVMWSLDTIEGR